jgi:UDP-glucose/iron transport system permease protein
VPKAHWLAMASIGTASGVALVVLFAGRAFSFEPQFFIPIAGMLIGNCMTVTSLAGARLRDELKDKVLEVEARLALGVPARDALKPYARRATSSSMIPTIDATKNAGLILLPGAFVGTILGGETPTRAAQVQIIVLFMLLGAVALAAIAATIMVSRVFVAPGERIVLPIAPD